MTQTEQPVVPIAMASSTSNAGAAQPVATAIVTNKPDVVDSKELTSKDYYFDSYSHFGIEQKYLKQK